MRRAILIALTLALSSTSFAYGRQYAAAGGHVVHTRRAPVILHRAVPPFKGVHVYQGGRR
jgi:hypothetical protein